MTDKREDLLDAAETAPVERIARVLAGHALSSNAEGDLASAARAVDESWPDYSDAALAVLRTLREPSGRMVAADDVAAARRRVVDGRYVIESGGVVHRGR